MATFTSLLAFSETSNLAGHVEESEAAVGRSSWVLSSAAPLPSPFWGAGGRLRAPGTGAGAHTGD